MMTISGVECFYSKRLNGLGVQLGKEKIENIIEAYKIIRKTRNKCFLFVGFFYCVDFFVWVFLFFLMPKLRV